MTIKQNSLKKEMFSQLCFKFIILIVAIVAILPFLLVLSGSFTSEDSILKDGFHLIPVEFSTQGYRYLFRNFYWILNGYKISTLVTIVGTFIGLLAMSMIAYPTSRKEMRYRHGIILFCYFTMLFSGGIVPWYIVCTKVLHMKDNIWALILPICIGPWNIILLRNFFTTIPDSLFESAKLDGAGDLLIFFRIVLPLSLPGIATIGLFLSVMFWNDWWLGIMLINKDVFAPLQIMLRNIVSSVQFLASAESSNLMGGVQTLLPKESVKMATTMITVGPIIAVYPFLQKYFIKGILIGSIKG